ncbi:hypothetical protein DXC08_11360 [Clostridium sp. OM07-9AC]|nr:hypothetical protein DXC08_11360 [Clostridium sp. OM07-9AC]
MWREQIIPLTDRRNLYYGIAECILCNDMEGYRHLGAWHRYRHRNLRRIRAYGSGVGCAGGRKNWQEKGVCHTGADRIWAGADKAWTGADRT